MGDGVGARLGGDLDQPLGDQRPRDRGAEQIDTFVNGIGAEHREDEIAHELLAHVLDEDLLDAHLLGLAARRLEVIGALAEIGREGDDLRAEFGLQPFEDDGGVEAARIGEHHLLHVRKFRHGMRVRLLAAVPRRSELRSARLLSGTARAASLARSCQPACPQVCYR
jgi:hypothetical protein